MNKKKATMIISTVIVCVLVLVLGVGKVTYEITNLLKEDTIKQLTEITNQSLTIVKQKTDSDISQLKKLAATISVLGGPQSDAAKQFITKEEWKTQGERLTVSDANGESYTNDGLTGNLSGEDVFVKAMAGETVISDIRPSVMDKEHDKVIVTIVPIYKDNAVVGTLASATDTKYYGRLVDFSIYGGKGYNYIVKSNGDIVVLDEHGGLGDEFVPTNNLQDKELLAKEPSLQQLKEDMSAKKTGTLKFKPENGGEMYLSYAPLGINDWYLINRISSKDIEGQKNLLRKEALAIVMVSVILFGALLFTAYMSYKRRMKISERVSMYDNLTGLPNWRYLQKYYTGLKTKVKRTYLILRIPDFKRISTVFGYHVGGRLLKDIAKELSAIIDEDEIVVHVSEDCFALLLSADNNINQAEKQINDILERVKIVEITDGNNIYDYKCTFVGGAYRVEHRDEDFSAVHRRANTALETILSGGEKSWEWFSPSMESKLTLQDKLMPDILNALKNDEFVPYFQPQYDVKSGEIVGAEVLARWQHPVHGTVLPGVFVPLLEASGCVLELDLIMLEQACKMIHGWLENGLLSVYLSVNISRLNIHRQDFFDRVIAIVKKYDVPPSLISLELGEMAVSENRDKVIKISKMLKQEGFILAMDDFATGSSINMLHELPIDTIKLARTFLLNFEAGDKGNIVLKHVVDMSHELGINIVAEGVETAEQDEMVKITGCNYAQGFFYNRPMSGMDFEELMFKENAE